MAVECPPFIDSPYRWNRFYSWTRFYMQAWVTSPSQLVGPVSSSARLFTRILKTWVQLLNYRRLSVVQKARLAAWGSLNT